MTLCNAVNVKLCNSQLNKLELGIKNGTEATCYQMLLVILMMKIIYCMSYS